MKFKTALLITTIAALLTVGCARTQKALDVLLATDEPAKSEASSDLASNETETPSNSSSSEKKEPLKAPKPPPTRLPDGSTHHKIPTSGAVWCEKAGKLDEIESEAALLEASIGQAFKQVFLFSKTGRVAVVANGNAAFVQLNTTRPIFYTRYKPNEVRIGRYIPQTERNRRYVWVTNQVGSNILNIYPYENGVAFDYSKVGDDFYKIVLREDLEPGEYAIGSSMSESPMLFNFGIEEGATRTAATSDSPTNNDSLIKQAQLRLAALGYDPGIADGIFGTKTGTALAEFQKANGIEVTGRLDDRTIKELNL